MRWPHRATHPPAVMGEPDTRDQRRREDLDDVVEQLKAATADLRKAVNAVITDARMQAEENPE